eukprot:156922_1
MCTNLIQQYEELHQLQLQCESIQSLKLRDEFPSYKSFYKELKTKLRKLKTEIAITKTETNGKYYQLIFDIKCCIFKTGDPTKLLFSIYDNSTEKFLTQQYCLHLSQNNFPMIGSPDELKVLFKHLTANILKSDIYIICKIYRIGAMQHPNVINPNWKSKKHKRKMNSPLVRPYGISILRLTDHIYDLVSNMGEVVTIQPSLAPIYQLSAHENVMQLIHDAIQQNNNIHSQIAPLSIGIAHDYTLYQGNINTVENNYKHFDQLTMLDTLENITDTNMFLITILEAHVLQRAKRAKCNVKITIELRHNDTKEKYTECIKFGDSTMSKATDIMECAIFYHNNDPIINQMFTVVLRNVFMDMQNYHLYISCWHTPATHFKPDERGFGFIKLVELMSDKEYKEYIIPLYRNTKKAQKINYLLSESKEVLKSENKNVKIGINAANISKYVEMIIFGYMHSVENLIQKEIPSDLKSLIFCFLFLVSTIYRQEHVI